ncbi:MAG: ImmA/IrrE family metallo-endopeptidase [Deltaproteobacteria bacterium]|nr:ImmA/IrrE family metallo-endopeptidase [Deltaproteobacteria bacterium]
MGTSNEVLRTARQILGLSADHVERDLRLAPGQLGQIEQGREPLATEHLDALAALYGLDAGDVAAGMDTTAQLRRVQILFKNWRSEVPEKVRSEIARAAAARRAVKRLERELGKPERYDVLRAQFRHEGTYGPPESGWSAGRDLAERLRGHLGIGLDAPIPSMRDLVAGLGIELVPAALSAAQVAAFSLADQDHGPAIVINLRGANSNPWVRRFVIAHELCHVLHDELTHEDIQQVQYHDERAGGFAEAGPEPRANAFAAHLIARPRTCRARSGTSWSTSGSTS